MHILETPTDTVFTADLTFAADGSYTGRTDDTRKLTHPTIYSGASVHTMPHSDGRTTFMATATSPELLEETVSRKLAELGVNA